MDLNRLSKEIYKNNLEKGWDNDDFLSRLCLIHSEVSEACEHYRNHKKIDEIEYTGYHEDRPDGIPIELADIIIRVLDTCGKYNIDINKAVYDKIKYNKTRSYKHGGKKA